MGVFTMGSGGGGDYQRTEQSLEKSARADSNQESVNNYRNSIANKNNAGVAGSSPTGAQNYWGTDQASLFGRRMDGQAPATGTAGTAGTTPGAVTPGVTPTPTQPQVAGNATKLGHVQQNGSSFSDSRIDNGTPQVAENQIGAPTSLGTPMDFQNNDPLMNGFDQDPFGAMT
ncbi:MAG: hypothetical protein DRQ39_03670 [Gammaproteobacteria bacterium]|nr:MAG: hypothetical protein DRQ39_03670 [Gammaproteobacteria bacterium]